MGSLHMFSHHCESTVKTFGRLQTYYPPMAATPSVRRPSEHSCEPAWLSNAVRFKALRLALLRRTRFAFMHSYGYHSKLLNELSIQAALRACPSSAQSSSCRCVRRPFLGRNLICAMGAWNSRRATSTSTTAEQQRICGWWRGLLSRRGRSRRSWLGCAATGTCLLMCSCTCPEAKRLWTTVFAPVSACCSRPSNWTECWRRDESCALAWESNRVRGVTISAIATHPLVVILVLVLHFRALVLVLLVLLARATCICSLVAHLPPGRRL
jgi:hypothetical protein